VILTNQTENFYAINHNGDENGFGLAAGFLDSMKWTAMTGGMSRTEAGPSDISYVHSAGPFSIPAGEKVELAFAFVAGNDLTEIRNAAKASRLKYDFLGSDLNESGNNTPSEFKLYQNYPNPFNPETKIEFNLREKEFTTLTVYDILGREVVSLINSEILSGRHTINFNGSGLSSGAYFYRLVSGNHSSVRKLLILK